MRMAMEQYPVPDWIVCGAGTGRTSATIGRFRRSRRYAKRLCVANPTGSVFHQHWVYRAICQLDDGSPCIEGIGGSYIVSSFLPDVLNDIITVDDAESVASASLLSLRRGRRCGGSTGANLWACSVLAARKATVGQTARSSPSFAMTMIFIIRPTSATIGSGHAASAYLHPCRTLPNCWLKLTLHAS